MRRLFLPSFTAFLLATAGLARAADGAGELEELLAQPVYGSARLAAASKYEQDAADAPSLVYVRSGGEIRAQGYRTLAQVLESMPGVHLRYDRVYTYTGVRGIDRPGDYSSRLLLMIDGMRVNEAIYDSATAGLEFPIDVALIDRVEFIPGPGSSLYGSNAVLGVVNVVTLSPSQLQGVRTSLELGSAGMHRLGASWGGDLGPVRALFGASSLRSRGGDLYYPEYDHANEHFGIVQGFDGERADKLFAQLRWSDFAFTTVLSDRFKSDPTGSYGTLFDTRSDNVDRYALADLSYSHALSDHREVFARLGLSSYGYEGYGLYGDPARPVPGQSLSDARWLSGEVRHVWSGWAGHRVLLGAEFQRNQRQHMSSADLDPAPQTYFDLTYRTLRYGLFVNDEWQALPALRLNLGLRSDRGIDGHLRTTPRVAALWSASQALTFKIEQGSSFREPNISESSYSDSHQLSAPGLRVESSRSSEFTTLWRPLDGLDFSASVYALRIQDLIDFVALPDGGQQYQNQGRITTKGLELEGTWVAPSGLKLRGSWSNQHTRDATTGQPLSDSPQNLAKGMLTLPGPWAGARLGTNLVYVGPRRTVAGATLAGHTLVNLQLTHAPADQAWMLGLGVDNLFDRRWSDPGSVEHRQDTLAQDGRTWRLQIEWTR